jgi:cAMP phosphodiesterase
MAGRDSQLQCLTSFLVGDNLAIDGGSIGFALKPEEMARVRHIIVTHTHSDHTASLPIFIAEAFVSLDGPVTIYGLPEVVSALREYVFNDKMWPDFEKIPLMNGSSSTIRFETIEPRKTLDIGGLAVTPVPVNHIVPTVGLVMQSDGAAVTFTSDTYVTDEIWQVARRAENLKAVFVDISFPNELAKLAADSKHLTPQLLEGELRKLDRDVEVYAVHIKPTNRDEVIRQLGELKNPLIAVGEVNRVYEW